MSAYGDWKYGIITEDQYRMACAREETENDYVEDDDLEYDQRNCEFVCRFNDWSDRR